MSERYSRVYSLPEPLYCSSAPVIIKAGALLKDNASGNILAQLKFQNISSQIIRGITVSIYAKDLSGADVAGVESYQYLDLSAARDQEFGQQTPINLPNAFARSFTCQVVSVIFADGAAWNCPVDGQWNPIPAPRPLGSMMDRELAEQYMRDTNTSGGYTVQDMGDLWYCTCGTINQSSEPHCHHCKSQKEALISALNTEILTEHFAAYSQQMAETQAAAEAIAAKRKRKKITISVIIASILAVLAIAGIVVASIVVPIMRENERIEKLKAAQPGDYIVLGTYEQDGNTDNGAEEIEWLVLKKTGNKMLLISKDILEYLPYNNTNTTGVTWDKCSLRDWMNGEFLNSAFTDKEQQWIDPTLIPAENSEGYNKGTATEDKIFLMSFQEINRSGVYCETCSTSKYALIKGASPKSLWMQRSVFAWDTVLCYGEPNRENSVAINKASGVRPAMWIEIN